MIECTTRSVEDTQAFAAAIAGLVRPRDIVVLAGEMGAGKTAFAVGFTRALGVGGDDLVSSPTFTLVHSYTSGRIPVLHADLYRLTSTGEIADLGLREQVDLGAVALVEWGDVALDEMGDCLVVTLSHDDADECVRHVEVSVEGHAWDARWERLRDALRPWGSR